MTHKVLLIEDDPDIREIVCVILKSQSYDVTQAVNGKEGLSLLTEVKPDLIILDLLMPGMDGFNVYRGLRGPDSSEYRDVPVIILSSVDPEASRQRYEMETGLKLAPNAYLEKPVVPAVLIQKVKSLLDSRSGP